MPISVTGSDGSAGTLTFEFAVLPKYAFTALPLLSLHALSTMLIFFQEIN